MRILMLLVLLCCPALASADCGRCFSGTRRAVIVAPVLPYYYQVRDYSAPPYLAGADVDAILNTARDLERLKSGLQQLDGQVASRVSGNARRAVLGETDLDRQARAVFTRHNCLKCHAQADAKGGFVLENSGRLLPPGDDKRWKVFGYTATGRMPPGEAHLSDAELDVIRRWADAKKEE